MKSFSSYATLCGILICLLPSIVWAKFEFPKAVQYQEVPVYTFPTDSQHIVLNVPYAKPEILDVEKMAGIKANQIFRIELVFTRYPWEFEDWRTDYDWLLENRLKNLYALDSMIFDQRSIQWHFILQTDPHDEPAAKTFFHGFVIHWSPIPFQDTPGEGLTEMEKDHPDITMLIEVIYGKKTKIPDSSIVKILLRHPEWKDVLVVMDWTASMYRNGASLMRWHRERIHQSPLKDLVIFNDGGGKPHFAKRIGRTGGIYYCKPTNIDSVITTMARVKSEGLGGDAAENDIEALLRATHSLKGYKEVLLIPDRNSSIRDLKLIRYLKQPVHILLFHNKRTRTTGLGTSGKWVRSHWIHPNYLTLASMTGGTLHTETHDISHLSKMKSGEVFTYDMFSYVKQENGVFKYVRK